MTCAISYAIEIVYDGTILGAMVYWFSLKISIIGTFWMMLLCHIDRVTNVCNFVNLIRISTKFLIMIYLIKYFTYCHLLFPKEILTMPLFKRICTVCISIHVCRILNLNLICIEEDIALEIFLCMLDLHFVHCVYCSSVPHMVYAPNILNSHHHEAMIY